MRGASGFTVGAILAALACGTSGCEPSPQELRLAATSRPATAPAPKPLPAKALVKLDDLTPKIAKPVNPPDADKLPERAKAAVQEADERITKRDFDGAIALLERAVGFAPNNPRIRRTLGLAYARLPNTGKALENLSVSAKVAPDDLTVQLLLGAITASQKQDDKAIIHLRTALKCSKAKPNDPLAAEALLRLSELLKKQGYWTAALQCKETLREWIGRHGHAYATRSRLRPLVLKTETMSIEQGQLLMLLRRYTRAVEQFRRAFGRDRTDPRTAGLLMDALLAAGDYKLAEKTLVEIVSEPVQRKQAARLAERLYLACGDKGVLVRLWGSHSSPKEMDSDFAVSLAEVAQRIGADDQAIVIAKSVLAKQPGNAAAGKLMCAIYARQGKAEKALRMLADMLASDPAAIHAIEQGIKQVLQSDVEDEFERKFARLAIADRSDVKHALHYVAGKLAAARSRKLLAADQFKRAIDAKLKFLPGYEALVDVYLAEQDYDKVERLVRRIDKVAGDSHFANYIRGKVHLARGRAQEAVAALIKALEFDGRDVRALLLLAEAYGRMGLRERSQAITRLSQALKIEPDNVEIYRRLFEQLISAGTGRSRQQARALVQSFLKRRPQSIPGRLMLVKLDLADGKRSKALALLAQLAKEAPKNVEVALMRLSVELGALEGRLSEKDFRRLADRLDKILRLEPKNVKARRMLGSLLARQGKHQQAVAMWRQLYQELSGRLDIAAVYAQALMRTEQFKTAVEVLTQIAAKNPGFIWAKRMLIDALVKLKQYDKADEVGRKWLAAANTDQEKLPARLSLLKLYQTSKKYDKGHKLLDDWLVGAPDRLQAALREQKLELYGQGKQFDKAIEYARQWIKEAAGSDVPKFILLRVLEKGKAYDKSLKLLDEWIGKGQDESVTIYRHYKVSILGHAGKYQEAIDYVSKWLAKSPRELEPRRTLVSVLVRGQKYDQATSQLETWMKQLTVAATTAPSGPASRAASKPASKPASGPASSPASKPAAAVDDKKTQEILQWCRQTIVRLLAMQGEYTAAMARAEVFLRLDEKDTELLSVMSSCLSSMGKDREARTLLEKALKIKPNDPGLNNNLGYLYTEQGIKLDEAERMIRKALAGKPVAAFMDSLGWVLYKKGRLKEAAATFKKVLDLIARDGQDHSVIHDHIGDTYYRQGRVEEALEQWKQAVKIAQEDKVKTTETKRILSATAGKIKALQAGKEPKVAPFGKDVTATSRPTTAPASKRIRSRHE